MVIPWRGLAARATCSRASSRRRARSTSRSARCSTRRGCPASAARCSTGRTARGCASTRRCTRSRCSPPACTAATCRAQNGAPLRLVVPWKYGFKSIKSIVSIRLQETQPQTSWNLSAPERVRLLLERESRGRPPALEPEARAAHRRLPPQRARSRSTATPSRWRSSTREWIFARTSDRGGGRVARGVGAFRASSRAGRPGRAHAIAARLARSFRRFAGRSARTPSRRSSTPPATGRFGSCSRRSRSRRRAARSAGPFSRHTGARSGSRPSATARCIC